MSWELQNKPRSVRYLAQTLVFLIGIVAGAFLLFQVLFLMKVIPHGGL